MTKLGSWPSNRYNVSWVTQRLANRAPEFTKARKWSYSTVQQVLNPVSQDIQRVNQQLIEERNNMFLTSVNLDLIDGISQLELGVGMKWAEEDRIDGDNAFLPPSVYATISGTEYEITQAEKNNIETMMYNTVPSRLEDAETVHTYSEVIDRTYLSDLHGATPASLEINGHLIITIRNNTTWSFEMGTKTYFSKVFIKGKTRQGQDEVVESIPIRYNGSFKTVHQWKSIEEIYTMYMDDTAEITAEVLAFDQDSFLDVKNLIVLPNGTEAFRFLRIENKTYGTILVSEGFTEPDISVIQKGFDTKEKDSQIELHNDSGQNINATGMAIDNNNKWLYVVDSDKLYVYDYELPFPDVTIMEAESTNTKMDLYSDRMVYARDDVAVIHTDTLDVSAIPRAIRWTLQDPNGDTWYLGQDGSTWPLTTNAWIDNEGWDEGIWIEHKLDLLLSMNGTYILTIECLYADSGNSGETKVLSTKHLLFTPAITPEATFDLPTALKGPENISFGSEGDLWILKYGNIHKLNLFHDYFLVDYEAKKVFFREDYSSVRVVTQ